ncbi:aspartic peptidase A1 [Amanita rubescens]|nr:aspartic peptidase A1 [Amanita rubescens]
MFPEAQVLNTLVLALVLAANPASAAFNMALTRHVNTVNARDVLTRDQARASYLATGSSNSYSQAISNRATHYTAQVGVGTPPTNFSLLIDTGSSNLWLGANLTYVKTSSSVPLGQNFSITYGSGNVTGAEFNDTITLGQLKVYNQSIGVSNPKSAHGFNGFDGIIGIGPVDLTIGTLKPDNTTKVPTITDNAFSQKVIGANEIGVSYEPTTASGVANGELTWGGYDSTKFKGSLHYASLTSTSPAGQYWGVNQTVSYGSHLSIMGNSAGIVDTGTTLILLATDAWYRYGNATGATFNSTVGLLEITAAQYEALQPLTFTINGKNFTLTPDAQVWPRALNTNVGGVAGAIYLVAGDLGTMSGQGLDWINGYTWLERFYTLYDTTNKRIGFANTPFTTATTNYNL